MRSPRLLLRSLLIFSGLLLFCASLRAEPRISGTYRCHTIRVGDRVTRCSSPPLILYPDGNYQIWAERGTYSVLGKYLVLSESKKRGPGRLRRNEIVFEYYSGRKKHTVTFRRHQNVPPGTAVVSFHPPR